MVASRGVLPPQVEKCTEDALVLWESDWREDHAATLDNFRSFYSERRNRYRVSMSDDKR